MAVKYFQTFRPSSEYETASAEAQRRQALAEALQQQEEVKDAFLQINPRVFLIDKKKHQKEKQKQVLKN